MGGRYIKAQLTVLLFGGLVGPIFLIVYFALGPFARPYIGWMFWTGLLITAADVLAALWLTNAGIKSSARHEELNQRGVLVLAQITGISDTNWFVNDQQMIKVNLHFDVPGYQASTPRNPWRRARPACRSSTATNWWRSSNRAPRSTKSIGMPAL